MPRRGLDWAVQGSTLVLLGVHQGSRIRTLGMEARARWRAWSRLEGRCWPVWPCRKGYGMVSRWKFQNAFA